MPVFLARFSINASSKIGSVEIMYPMKLLSAIATVVLNVIKNIFSFAEVSLSEISASNVHAAVMQVPHAIVVSIALVFGAFRLMQDILR